MKRIANKNNEYYQLHHNIVEQYELTEVQTLIYAFLHHQCSFVRKKGSWCGLSNREIGERLPIKKSHDVVKRTIKVLEDKKLVFKANEGTSGRRLYINMDVFSDELDTNGNVVEHSPVPSVSQVDEALKKENEELKKQLEMALKSLKQKEKEWTINFASKILVESKLISKKQFNDNWEEFNEIMMAFYKYLNGDLEQLKKCCFYWKEMKKGTINNPVGYLLECIEDFKVRRKYDLV